MVPCQLGDLHIIDLGQSGELTLHRGSGFDGAGQPVPALRELRIAQGVARGSSGGSQIGHSIRDFGVEERCVEGSLGLSR